MRHLGCTSEEIVKKTTALLKKNTELFNANMALQSQLLAWNVDKIAAKGIKICEMILVYEEFPKLEIKTLKEAAIKSANNVKNALVVFSTIQGEQSSIIIAVSNEISERVSALKILSIITEIFQSKGGGNSLLAQTGVPTKSLRQLNLLSALQEKLNQ